MRNTARTVDVATMPHQLRTRTTLLEVVTTVAEMTTSDEEVVAVIDHLFRSGRMKLLGEFTEQDFRLY